MQLEKNLYLIGKRKQVQFKTSLSYKGTQSLPGLREGGGEKKRGRKGEREGGGGGETGRHIQRDRKTEKQTKRGRY